MKAVTMDGNKGKIVLSGYRKGRSSSSVADDGKTEVLIFNRYDFDVKQAMATVEK